MGTKVIFEKLGIDGIESLKVYQKNEGYEGLKKALNDYTPDELIEYIKGSGLRGRGGAGFPTGLKWSFVPKNPGKPKYLCVNCDESEPGTCKDRDMVTYLPHQLLEGIAICCYAVGIEKAFIYIRGEMLEGAEILERAVQEAVKKKLLGNNILGTGFNLDVVVHRGAGAYICGEESALLSSLEGERGFPRLKPPFPAVEGLYACPTVINNVETLSTLPAIMRKGADWYSAMGTERSKGTRVLCLSGHVHNPGNYELELGTSMRELIEVHGGGVMGGELKAIIPGGASAPMLTKEHLDISLDFEAIAEAGSMAGSGAVIVINDKTCIVRTCLNLDQFFEEESCGKCTPCREGTKWLVDILTRMVNGKGREDDIDLLKSVCDNLCGKSFCPLGDSATSCITSAFRYFPEEFEHYVKHGCSILDAKKEMAAN
jgi:NADH-quinone oxidoreductase subunit F